MRACRHAAHDRQELSFSVLALLLALGGCATPLPPDQPYSPIPASASPRGGSGAQAGVGAGHGSGAAQRRGSSASSGQARASGAADGSATAGTVRRHALAMPRCVFTPAHGTADGQTIPPSYDCEQLSAAQFAAGRCQEVKAYEREDGTFVPGHTRCLADPRAPAWVTPALDHGPAGAPGATAAAGVSGAANTTGNVSTPGTGVPARPGRLPDGQAPALQPVDTLTDEGLAPPQPGGVRRGDELLLPDGAPQGIDQGNDTFVRPITAPGSVDGR